MDFPPLRFRWPGRSPRIDSSKDAPIRSELYSLERLEQHAESLAMAQPVVRRKAGGGALLRNVKRNAHLLRKGFQSVADSIRDKHAITPAAEWLADNFHIVEEQIREIIDDLPPGFYRTLPKLASGPLAGTPRVYGIVWAFVEHTDSRLDSEWLRRFINAYQRVEPLDIGEGWALPIALRIVLIENLRRITDRIRESIRGRADADRVADDFLRIKETRPGESVARLMQRLESRPLSQSFSVQLARRLREQGPQATSALEWLDGRLAAQNMMSDDIVRREHQEQTAMNGTVRNIITSMRLLSSMDWSDFFESISVVDRILRDGSLFGSMDFPTRDLYRHAVEDLSRGAKVAEVEVVRRALEAAREANARPNLSAVERARQSDPGFYLVSKGRAAFERALRFQVSIKHRLLRTYMAWATPAYLGSVVLVSVALVGLLVYWTDRLDPASPWLWVFALLSAVPASDVALALVNRWVTTSLGPRLLPKLDFEKGVPLSARTLVVVPTLLSSEKSIEENLDSLAIHYLSNADGYLQFALLSDWTDAATERVPNDDSLLKFALKGISDLNQRYGRGPDNHQRFFLFHRNRLWNEQEKKWMGWERKRGKLHELNLLLRGRADTTFLRTLPIPEKSGEIRYVITLDADSRLSRGTAYQLAASMSHPLNRPRYDEKAGRVVDGYGIIQPRVTPTLPVPDISSLFQWIFSGSAGIDPYAFAVSDVYQDLFKEGSYVGKGIYDIDTFEHALKGRVPENRMLSHDLFEGLYAGAALVTEIELFEEFPSHYEVDVARHHRWARGDWQLLPWILRPSTLPLIARWKMIDNLRRSVSAPLLLLALWATWISPAATAPLWSVMLLTTVILPPLLAILGGLWPHRTTVSLRSHLRGLWTDLKAAAWHIVLAFAFLPHQAAVMVDAIVRTLYRMYISHTRLLEWTSAAQAKDIYDYKLGAFYRRMISAPVLAALCLTSLLYFGNLFAPFGMALCVLWFFSPLLAQRISVPVSRGGVRPLTLDEKKLCRQIARRTWRFFETFVTPATNSLPPDNFQEIPAPVVALRTSPTNIGLGMLSTVAAYDFGWLGLSDMTRRLEDTLSTVEKVQKHEGHLFNWYDVSTLAPLEPLYVSTVDSGNLAGHLWAVAAACREFSSSPLRIERCVEGLNDVLSLVREAASRLDEGHRAGTVTVGQLREPLDGLEQWGRRALPTTAVQWADALLEAREQAVTLVDVARALVEGDPDPLKNDFLTWSQLLLEQLDSYLSDTKSRSVSSLDLNVDVALRERLERLAQSCVRIADAMKFGFLLDPNKKIFSIGYQVGERKLDASYYDLMASESRLASYVAIAKGDVPTLHWFRLGRSLKPMDHGLVLLSWSGSMFEYLMPSLVMQSPQRSLIDQTNRRVVETQISYGSERHVPWGISESAYNAQNLEYTYQYSNFGVPTLGLKRGLGDDTVVAPYATALATMVNAPAAVANFERLKRMGALGTYGYYEALDFTSTRLPENQQVAIVRAYMAHHQGMSLVSLSNVLHSDAMRSRFHSDPRVQAAELLLQEKTPRNVPVTRNRVEEVEGEVRLVAPLVLRRFHSAHHDVPPTHLLSNGHYSVMVTAAGSGYSRAGAMAITRWKEDTTRDNWGTFVFLRDTYSSQIWSAGYQPIGTEPDRYEVDFSEDRAEIIRHDGNLITTLEVVVSPEDDAEIRRVSVKNNGGSAREIDVTSYAEVVLATPAADQAHPAFSNLFVQTEFVAEANALLCTRRQRSPSDPSVWLAHVAVVEGPTVGVIQYETDRSRFLGRGRGVRTPMCVIDGKPLTNTVGDVLDPVMSLRQRIRVEPGATVHISFTTAIASTRDDALRLADKYHDPAMFERTVTLAWTQAHVQQNYLGIEPSEAHLFQNLATRLIYSHNALRPSSDILKRNTRGAPGLWSFGISGDLPIVLVRIDEVDDLQIVREILRAHEYWRMKNLGVDLVILNERTISYTQDLQVALENLVRATQASLRHEMHGAHGKIFLLRLDQISGEDHILLRTAARITLLSRQGSLAQQVGRLLMVPERRTLPPLRRFPSALATPNPKLPLEFFNGLGGFSEDGKEYVTVLGPGQWTPAPWVNVVSNPNFGFHVSEAGSGCTWSINSRENQITPWSNDPVGDAPGEVFYLRDDDTGHVWTPTLLPIREEDSSYVARHTQGSSRFEHTSRGIRTSLLQYVPVSDPIKISRLTLTNMSAQSRRISVTAYIEWVLGTSRSASAPFLITDYDPDRNAIVANNPWSVEFGQRLAFAAWRGGNDGWTADRTEILGRNGTLDHPVAIEHDIPLTRSVGAGMDPCAALRKSVELRPGKSVELVFFLGQEVDRDTAMALLSRFENEDLDAELEKVRRQWEDALEAVQIKTPDRALDILVNHWLLYQTLACRLWSRAGFYQAGGAYGFRDQLQDIMALIVSRRDVAREQILRAARRQFQEGDVQHWWHPPTGRGVRTKISDDLIWLPYVVLYYLEVTGDRAILDETLPFLDGKPIPEGREDLYYEPAASNESATLFEHCARTLDRSLLVGGHGLPLMGTGDWNDGMNRIGHEGKGESVWLAWFLHTTLWEFAKVAQVRNEHERAEKWRLHCGELKTAVERNAWDGEWYARAFFDDGRVVGASANLECRIDSIAQSWGVLSGGADPSRAKRAMEAVRQNLVKKDDGMVLIFTPPFDHTHPSPGYIQGYLPGVRENGGQYTHAAIWSMLAFAALGDGNTAGELISMLNPINHGKSRTDIHRYKVEPYVMAGDVYATSTHLGRGGWTWYTGSAGWMYRGAVEWLLGFRLRENALYFDPCIPEKWDGFEIAFRYHATRYKIKVENPSHVCRGVASIEMDGKPVRGGAAILLTDDKGLHDIRVVMGA